MRACAKLVVLSLCLLTFALWGISNAGVRDYIPIVKATYPEKTLTQFATLADYFLQLGDTAWAVFFADLYQGGAWHGSGFVVTGEGGTNYVITNRHVAINSVNVNLEFQNEDGSSSTYDNCEILYVDDKMDLAVIQFPRRQSVFRHGFPLVGEFQPDATSVYSAGYPGLMGSQGWQLATGNISNCRAHPPFISTEYPYLIQHTASIDPGNSGGPLLVRNTESPTGYGVVGVNTWTIRNRQNTFFSIPIVAVEEVLQKAKASERIKTNPQLLKQELTKNCNILAAELGSEHMSGQEVKKYISYDFVAENGLTSFLQLTQYNLPDVSLETMYEDPIETMRTAIFYHFWLSLQERSQGDLSGIRFEGINYADEQKLDQLSRIRTNYNINGRKTEINWIFEYGTWKIAHLVLSDLGATPQPDDDKDKKRKDKTDDRLVGGGGGTLPPDAGAERRFSLGLSLGTGIPLGDMAAKEQYVSTEPSTFLDPIKEGPLAASSAGFAIGAVLDYKVSSHVAIGADMLYSKFGYTDDYFYEEGNTETTHNIMSFGAHLKYFFSAKPSSFYLMGGAGMFTESYTIEGDMIVYIDSEPYQVFFDVDESKSDFGMKIGAGYIFSLSPALRFNLGANYNKLLNAETIQLNDGSSVDLSTEYATFTADILFSFGGK
jgi:S1-C subfamily serine protease/opacity protein-like surface antigen